MAPLPCDFPLRKFTVKLPIPLVHAVLIAGAVLLAIVDVHAAENAIVVGQAIDLSGPNGSIGRDYVAGITTYFDSLNTKGGLNGKKIRFVVRDDAGNSAESARLAGSLIKQDQADYLLGGIGADATRAVLGAPAFTASRHVLFAPLADAGAGAGAGKPGRVVFWRPSVEREFGFILAYFDKLGVKRIGIALQDSPHNRRTYQLVQEAMRQRGMSLAGTAALSGTAASVDSGAAQLHAAGAKLVLMISDTIGAAQFLKAFRKVDIATFVAGTSLINLATLSEIAGRKATEWTVFSQVVPNPASHTTALQSEHLEMMKKFRDEPVSAVTLEGFAVAKTLVKVMQLEAGGRASQYSISAGKTGIDLGGMLVGTSGRDSNLSDYVDIALFKRDGGLMY